MAATKKSSTKRGRAKASSSKSSSKSTKASKPKRKRRQRTVKERKAMFAAMGSDGKLYKKSKTGKRTKARGRGKS